MTGFKEITCPVDFSESSIRAFSHAAALVRWYGGHLTVLHVIPPFDLAQMPGDLGDPIRIATPPARERVLDEMRRVFDLADLLPQASLIVAESGDPRTVIVDQAVSKGADLIVMGTHGKRRVADLGRDRQCGRVRTRVSRDSSCGRKETR